MYTAAPPPHKTRPNAHYQQPGRPFERRPLVVDYSQRHARPTSGPHTRKDARFCPQAPTLQPHNSLQLSVKLSRDLSSNEASPRSSQGSPLESQDGGEFPNLTRKQPLKKVRAVSPANPNPSRVIPRDHTDVKPKADSVAAPAPLRGAMLRGAYEDACWWRLRHPTMQRIMDQEREPQTLPPSRLPWRSKERGAMAPLPDGIGEPVTPPTPDVKTRAGADPGRLPSTPSEVALHIETMLEPSRLPSCMPSPLSRLARMPPDVVSLSRGRPRPPLAPRAQEPPSFLPRLRRSQIS
jgi:hypothetical protein